MKLHYRNPDLPAGVHIQVEYVGRVISYAAPCRPSNIPNNIKGTLSRNFRPLVFHQTNPLSPLIHCSLPKLFFNINSNPPRYSYSNNSLFNQYTQKKIFVSSCSKSKFFNYSSWVLGHVANMHTVFSKKCPYKRCKENNFIPNIQFLGGAWNFTDANNLLNKNFTVY
jgi:hypothetical protein